MGFGPKLFLRRFFERLDTTPGQEKAIVAAVEELVAVGKGVHKDGKAVRAEVAAAIGQPVLDEGALAGAEAKIQASFETIRDASLGALRKIHEALDPAQRRKLGELIESGPRFAHRWRGHPYRCGL